jgi:hypothetical protein
MSFYNPFSGSSTFSITDFWETFTLDDVLTKAKDWQDSVPKMSYSFSFTLGTVSNSFKFTSTQLSENLQLYVSDLTGIPLANSPYTLTSLISNSGSVANSAITALKIADLKLINYSGDIKIDALLDKSLNWNYLNPARNVLYYSFDVKNFDDSKMRKISVEAFNTAQQEAARTQLKYVTDITGIQFKEVATTSAADIHFANTNLEGKYTAGLCDNSYRYHYNKNLVTDYIADAYIYLDNVEWNVQNENPTAGGQGYETLLHEIGHALGLKHPFETPKTLSKTDDNTNNTVMSYLHKGDYKTTFQSYDLAALNWLYGTDGLTALPVKATAGNDLFIGTSNADIINTLAGNDTLDGGTGRDTLTGGDGNDAYVVDDTGDKIIETNKFDIDSVQSSVNFTLPKYVENLTLTGKATLAIGNELENKLIGNELANTLKGLDGNDTLEGGKGNDALTGGLGEDTFVFSLKDYDFMGDFAPRAENIDTVVDFTKGTDKIALSAAFAFKGFAVVANLKQSVGDASLIYDNATNALYFDADSAGNHYSPTMFIKFTGKMSMAPSDLALIA